MSKQGIQMAAKVFSQMQEARGEIMRLANASGNPKSKSAHQDILLAQMLETAKESVKDTFCKLTMMKTEDIA